MYIKEDAATWCDLINSDRTCPLMIGLSTEEDQRCKLFRDEQQDCRYFRLYVMSGRGRRANYRGGRKREQREQSV